MEQRVGSTLRAVRVRRGLRQEDVAAAAGVSRSTVSRLERGHLAWFVFGTTVRVAAALDVRLDVVPRWRGGELDRLLNARHSAMHELVAARFAHLPGWQVAPEASFSIYGERGAVDVLGWHAARGMLLVVELKTEIVDVQELLASVDRKRRLAARIGSERGWQCRRALAGAWVLVADGRTNRARLARHVAVLRTAFPTDGRTMAGWLADPREPISALSFMQISHPPNAAQVGSPGRGAHGRRPDRERIRSCED
jgi:transcriptional regulator with XRE-family HTH domain